jgi:hypothetical protein
MEFLAWSAMLLQRGAEIPSQLLHYKGGASPLWNGSNQVGLSFLFTVETGLVEFLLTETVFCKTTR